jgi:hypothetical protein
VDGFGESYPFFDSLDECVIPRRQNVVAPDHNVSKLGDFFKNLDGRRRFLFIVDDLNVVVDSSVARLGLCRLWEKSVGRFGDDTWRCVSRCEDLSGFKLRTMIACRELQDLSSQLAASKIGCCCSIYTP